MSRADAARFAALALILVALISQVGSATAATSSDFSSASSSIGSAYSAVRSAQQSGGNVSSLVDRLNIALGLYMQAQDENAANPTRASADLQNASNIAQQVSVAAPSVGQTGAAGRQTQEYLAIGSAVTILVVAGLVYLYGERVYRRIWLRVYSEHVVRKIG